MIGVILSLYRGEQSGLYSHCFSVCVPINYLAIFSLMAYQCATITCLTIDVLEKNKSYGAGTNRGTKSVAC